MFIASLFLLFAAPKAPLPANDTAFLSRIDKAVSRMSDKKTAFVRFEKSVTKADAIRCNQVLPRVKPNSEYYADCAFAQAWYGIDYDANIQRLLRPYRLMKTDEQRWEREYPLSNPLPTLITLNSFYSSLNWLYLKHHDLKSLGAWEDLQLDGLFFESSSGALCDLWDNHAANMLRAAYGHSQRIMNLAAALTFSNGQENASHALRQTLDDVKPYTRSKNRQVASAAQALVKTLRSGKY